MTHTPRHAARTFARRAHVVLAALLLACAAAPSHTLAQSAPSAQTKPTPAPSPSPAAEAGRDQRGASARRAPTGTIKGRVVGDDGQSLAHATIYIYGRSSGAHSRQLPPASSDDDGRFSFDELEPGLYSLNVHLAGYTAETEAGGQPAAAGYRVGDDVTIRLVKGAVITGTVTTADGEPVVGANMRVNRLRTLDNLPPPLTGPWFTNQFTTDDRGVYRVYGLPPGVYVVSAGGGQLWNWMPPSPYDSDAPTYFRSATPDTAEEVTLRAGQEVGGVDIRYRAERGHTVSGALVFPAGRGLDGTINVGLVHAATGAGAGASGGGVDRSTFSFDGIADGEYELRASHYGADGGAATRQRVTVRGADVTGLRLMLAPYSSIGGDLALEPLREPDGACKAATRRALFPQEVTVNAEREDHPADAAQRRPATPQRREGVPDEAGAFLIRALESGRYHIDARPADEGWFVRDIQLPTAASSTAAPPSTSSTAAPSSTTAAATRPPAQRKDSASTVAATLRALDLKPGQQLTGLRITLAEGAASLAGRIEPREENAPLPPSSRLRVHLVPAAREQADNALRHYEATPMPDGSFSFRHLAPGRYLVLVREADAEAGGRPAARDESSRARLRREAEAADISVELQPCQRTTDFAVQFPAPRD